MTLPHAVEVQARILGPHLVEVTSSSGTLQYEQPVHGDGKVKCLGNRSCLAEPDLELMDRAAWDKLRGFAQTSVVVREPHLVIRVNSGCNHADFEVAGGGELNCLTKTDKMPVSTVEHFKFLARERATQELAPSAIAAESAQLPSTFNTRAPALTS